ncbi:50S ribosomal protein L24 [Xanthocytophaga agilis]|uniref:Large ribosomal subunit protein uL24 n=1 Tax=Xanthocytophaga agilis TaxID=3048010 RepID=A0AAE3UCI9_9BACT|nr:50S ribosomal protein L24 [Xanthocytophaga agilis]MDJ1500923.1 50S ribosomal protein L24 [Xanthocytophaga agilis]
MKAKAKTTVKLHVRKGDTVIVISGDEKGKTGKITSVDREKQKAVIEGLNLVKRSVKPSAENPQGGFIEKEAPIHVSNLMVVDPSTGKPSRISRKLDEKGKKQRYAKKTGTLIKAEF